MDSMRPAVPAPPPAYNTIHKVTAGRSLRPIVLFCTLCSFIWSLCIGVAYVKEMFKEGVSGRLMAMYIIQAVFFLFLALLELVGFYAAWRQQIRAGKLYTLLVIIGGVLVIVAESIRLALHFVFKTDIQSACAVQNRDDEEYVSAASIAEWCDSRWKNGIWRDVAWIVFGAICSVFMYILAKAYLHQLLDPNFGRQQAASGRYQMNPIETHHMPYSHSSGQDPPFVPPYGAPPHLAPGYAAPPTYDAPAYTPPEKGYNVSDSKATASERDVEQDSVRDGDLAGSNPFGRSDSEVTLQGREREGRI